MSYGARDHVAWLRSLDAFRERLAELAAAGAQARRTGLAWREASDGPLVEVGGGKRYLTEWLPGMRSLAALLPPMQRGIMGALVLNPDVELVVPAGPTIRDARRVARLHAECVRRLERHAHADVRAQDRERKALKAALDAIDPGRPPLARIDAREHTRPLRAGDAVTVNATVAARGTLLSVASTVGAPVLGGGVATVAGITPYVALPAAAERRYRQDDYAHGDAP